MLPLFMLGCGRRVTVPEEKTGREGRTPCKAAKSYRLAADPGDADSPNLPRAPEHSTHGEVHRVVAKAVQGFWATVTGSPWGTWDWLARWNRGRGVLLFYG